MNKKANLRLVLVLVGCILVFGLARYFPAEAAGRTFYVATNGNDNNPGTEAQPWFTLQKAANVMMPGDTTLVKNGTYIKYADVGAFVRFTRSGTRDAWITLKAYPGHKPKIVSPVWNAVLFENVSYIEVNGFEIQGVASTISKNNANGVVAKYSHHIIVRNNDVYDFPGGGIGSGWTDYFIVEGNKVHNTSKLSTYATSAISLYQLTNVDNWSGYHNIIRGNIVWDNANTVGKITDGNCIIIDRSRHPDANDNPVNPYTGRTLIENNVCFNNGGRGIHVYRSDHVYVTHNTLYMNQYTPGMDGSELSALYSGNSQFYNNIVYTRPGKIANNAHRANNISWGRNLYFNAAGVNPKAPDDIVGVDPRFVSATTNPATANFRLRIDSPALNLVTNGYVPGYDLEKNRRPFDGAADLGAYELMTVVSAAAQPAAIEGETMPSPVIPSGPALFLDVQPSSAAVGQLVTLNLHLKSVSNIYGLDVNCSVNPAVLTGGTRADGSIFNASNSFFVDGGFQADGAWTAAASLLNPAPAFSGDGIAFSLGYLVAADGSSDVTCGATGVDRDGRTIDVAVVNGVYGGAQLASRDIPAPETEAQPLPEIDPDQLALLESAFDGTALDSPAVPVIAASSVSGIASYQNRGDQMGIMVRLLSNNAALAELVTNADGSFSFTDVPDGNYTVELSAPQHLMLVANIAVVGGQAAVLGSLSLPAGDADNSNLIDLADAALIGANFRLAVPPGPASADLNGDGEINIADLVLVGSNYGSTGPVSAPVPAS